MSSAGKFAIGAVVGSAVVTGLLLWRKVSTLETNGVEDALRAYIEKRAEEIAKSYIADTYGITDERVTKLQALAAKYDVT